MREIVRGKTDKHGKKLHEGDKVWIAKSKWPAYQNEIREDGTYGHPGTAKVVGTIQWFDFGSRWQIKEELTPIPHPCGSIITDLSDYYSKDIELI